MESPSKLIKAIGLPGSIAIGLSGVVGSGIFVLFSHILQKAGGYAALAILFAAIPNIMGALSYAELGSRFQRNDTEDIAIQEAFGEKVSYVTTYLLLLFLIFNTATVILFCGQFIPEPYRHAGMLFFLALLSAVNIRGIELSTQLNEVVAYSALAMFIALIVSSLPHWHLEAPLAAAPQSNMAMATALSLFLFTGYDTIVKMSEETIDPGKTIPQAYVYTIVICTLLYMGLAMAAQSVKPFSVVANSHTPLSELAAYLWGSKRKHIATVAGVFVCICTAFVGMLGVSRFVYGLAKSNAPKLPKVLSTVNSTFHTPHVAILAVFAAFACIVTCMTGIRSAMLTNVFFMLFLIVLHSATLVIKKKDTKEDTFKTHPAIQWIGIVTSLGFALYLGMTNV